MSDRRHTTAAALILKESNTLLCLRSAARDWYPNVWELPGGHVQNGEDPRGALSRELSEELGISAVLDLPPVVVENAEARVYLWHVTNWTGEITNTSPEHSAIRWCTAATAQELSLGPLASHVLDEAQLVPAPADGNVE